ncbi:phosphatase domain-containing putative toxin [uncultured Pseudomonas sp.]|uniref:protein-tyrosine phosphatase family protein n=1 Tax=Pseudomonas sp. 22072 TaxID=3453865 RepID=UPI0028D7FE75|nr:protein tyrosine phosphatase [uncultured Pseudomonas sp.]
MNVDVWNLQGYTDALRKNGKVVFSNWVTLDKAGTQVFRSSQPYYTGSDDTVQDFDDDAINLLKEYNIKLIISLNANGVTEEGMLKLTAAGITHINKPVKDFGTPTLADLYICCQLLHDTITKGDKALIYCGFGAGRTGTLWSAFQIYSLPRNQNLKTEVSRIIKDSTAETTGQESVMLELATGLNVINVKTEL